MIECIANPLSAPNVRAWLDERPVFLKRIIILSLIPGRKYALQSTLRLTLGQFPENMKQLKIYSTLLVVTLMVISSCKYPDIPKQLEIRDHLKLDYAPYLKKTADLHPSAAVGLQNKYRDVYYIVVPQPWRNDSGYVKYLYDSLSNDLKNIKKVEKALRETMVLRDTTYTNEKGYFVQDLLLTGVLENQKLAFNMQLIQKDTLLFQTSGWCFFNKKDLWLKDIEAMNHSLTILDGRK